MAGQLRRFEILGRLGTGSLGATYHARMVERGYQRNVALKLLHPAITGHQVVAELYRSQGAELAHLNHPAIVFPEELVYMGTRVGVLSDLVEGPDLQRLVAVWGGLPARTAMFVGAALSSALGVAHRRTEGPLLHLDITPRQVALTAAGEVLFLDYGLKRRELGLHGRRHPIPATAGYMAPERFAGEDSPAGDIYALGATLFEILTGVPLGRTSQDEDRHYEHVGARIEQLTEIVQDAEPIVPLLSRMLEFQPSARPVAGYVHTHCARLAELVDGPTLAEWAPDAVAAATRRGPTDATSGGGPALGRRVDNDDVTGSILQEGRPSDAPAAEPDTPVFGQARARFNVQRTPIGAVPAAPVAPAPPPAPRGPTQDDDPAPVAVYAIGGGLLVIAFVTLLAAAAMLF